MSFDFGMMCKMSHQPRLRQNLFCPEIMSRSVLTVVLSNDPQYFSSGRWHRIGYKKIDMGPVHSIVSCRYDAPLGCG